MSEIVKPRRSTHYSAEEIERGLTTLAVCSGNTRRAEKVLAEAGHRVPNSTLHEWMTKHYPDRYIEIERERTPLVREKMARESDDLAQVYAELERQNAEEMARQIGEVEPRDRANLARSLATARGISTDKSQLLRGQPTEIRETRDIATIISRLNKKFPDLIVQGTAEEVTG